MHKVLNCSFKFNIALGSTFKQEIIGGFGHLIGIHQYSKPVVSIGLSRAHTEPGLLLQIPAHRGRKSLLEAVARLPAQLAADPGWINRVTPVVTRAIRHRRDHAAVGGAPAGSRSSSALQIASTTSLFVRSPWPPNAAAHPRGLPRRASRACSAGDHWPPCSLNRGCVGRKGWFRRSGPFRQGSRTPHRWRCGGGGSRLQVLRAHVVPKSRGHCGWIPCSGGLPCRLRGQPYRAVIGAFTTRSGRRSCAHGVSAMPAPSHGSAPIRLSCRTNANI